MSATLLEPKPKFDPAADTAVPLPKREKLALTEKERTGLLDNHARGHRQPLLCFILLGFYPLTKDTAADNRVRLEEIRGKV